MRGKDRRPQEILHMSDSQDIFVMMQIPINAILLYFIKHT